VTDSPDMAISMTIANLKKRSDKYKRELDKATRLLCQVVGEMELDGYTFNEELTKWWENHQKMDAKRKKDGK
jgi:hypothetical protein